MAAWKAGSGSGGKIKAKAAHGFGKDLLKLAADIKVVGDGNLMMASTTFRAWRSTLLTLPPDKKTDLAEQVLILAGRYFREVGEPATDAVAQLLVLAGDLTGATVSPEDTAPLPPKKAAAPAPAKKAPPAPPAKKKTAAKK